MIQLTQKHILFILGGITIAAELFCLISIVTKEWTMFYKELFCSECPKAAGPLSIIALLILLSAIVLIILLAIDKLPAMFRASIFGALLLGTIFTLAAYTSVTDQYTGFSFKLMIVAHFFCYMASQLAAFWLGGFYAATFIA
jgi:hypothetical protein